MENKNFTATIEVAKSPQEVFNCLQEVPKWWSKDYEGSSALLNDEFIIHHPGRHYSKNKVVELELNKKVAWLVIESIRKTDNYKWTGTKMIFELTPMGDNTQATFTYDGVILENEYDRLVQICDFVIKEKLYNLIIDSSVK